MTIAYRATARRSGMWWAVEVPEVPGARAQGRSLREAEQMAREAVALLLDAEEDQVHIELRPELPRAATDILAVFQGCQAAREEMEGAERIAQGATARALKEASLSVRDAGAVLGISHQRIAQLALESAPANSEKARKDVTAAAGSTARTTKKNPLSSSRTAAARTTADTKTTHTNASARRNPQDA